MHMYVCIFFICSFGNLDKCNIFKLLFWLFLKVASGVNLLESLGIHFIILINPDNLRTHTIFMELGQALVRPLFLHSISVPGFKGYQIKRKC